eukprot:2267617-Pleurochrysis_carterae.AAC.3
METETKSRARRQKRILCLKERSVESFSSKGFCVGATDALSSGRGGCLCQQRLEERLIHVCRNP